MSVETFMNTKFDLEAFKYFIESEVDKRKMSYRQFAEFVGVSQPTITRAVGKKPKAIPSMEFLTKLATSLNYDLCDIVAIVAPNNTRRDAKINLIAHQMRNASPEQLRAIDSLLAGWGITSRQDE